MESMQKIEEIRRLAFKIDCSINLFEGFSPKKEEGKLSEVLFWRKIVNIYGLFCDCDRVVVKEKDNLLMLWLKYSIITAEQYSSIRALWNSISDIRGWFCHNNFPNRYYTVKRERQLTKYLNQAFILSSKKPETLDGFKDNDWVMVCADVQRRFDEYLEIVLQALRRWEISDKKKELIADWKLIYAKALYGDKELIQNVMADKIQFYCVDNKIADKNIITRQYNELIKEKYTQEMIHNILDQNEGRPKSADRIIYESMECLEIE